MLILNVLYVYILTKRKVNLTLSHLLLTTFVYVKLIFILPFSDNSFSRTIHSIQNLRLKSKQTKTTIPRYFLPFKLIVFYGNDWKFYLQVRGFAAGSASDWISLNKLDRNLFGSALHQFLQTPREGGFKLLKCVSLVGSQQRNLTKCMV